MFMFYRISVEKNSGPTTVFPHIRPTGIIILCSLQIRVLLENSIFLLHKVIRIACIIRDGGIIRGRVFYEEIWYVALGSTLTGYSLFFGSNHLNIWIKITRTLQACQELNAIRPICTLPKAVLMREKDTKHVVVSLFALIWFVSHCKYIQ